MELIVQEVELAWRSVGSLLNGREERSGSSPRKARAQFSVSRCLRLRTNQADFRHRCFLRTHVWLRSARIRPEQLSDGPVLRPSSMCSCLRAATSCQSRVHLARGTASRGEGPQFSGHGRALYFRGWMVSSGIGKSFLLSVMSVRPYCSAVAAIMVSVKVSVTPLRAHP
jgi:hypothetical protein